MRHGVMVLALCLAALAAAGSALAQETASPPTVDGAAETVSAPASQDINAALATAINDRSYADVIKILVLLSVLTMLPAIVLTMTSFTRVIIVLSMVKKAIGLQTMPPNTIIVGLSIFITAFVMAPVWKQIHTEAIIPLGEKKISESEAVGRGFAPLRKFMLRHTRKKDLELFMRVAGDSRAETPEAVPAHLLIPAFAISEIKTAFLMGFVIFLPMLVIDMMIATILTSMGMFMLPPMMISMPVKILLFVLVDGWYLVIGSTVQSFNMAL